MKALRLYVAASWGEAGQPAVVERRRAEGHTVYDFRNPATDEKRFAWHDIDPEWQDWNSSRFRAKLSHPSARNGFRRDMDAMEWADACVMGLPCGRSAQLECGWFIGQGKPAIILLSDGEPELMYGMTFNNLCTSLDEVVTVLDLHSEGTLLRKDLRFAPLIDPGNPASLLEPE